MSTKKLEIMAPAGNFEALAAAVQGGANSVYFGVENLNMRSHSANNFTTADLPKITEFCAEHGVKTYLTLNIICYDEDLKQVEETLQAAKAAGISAVIASDIAVITCARRVGLEVHISTQLNVSNWEAVKFWATYADVIVLARELNMDQVKAIHERILAENLCGPAGKPVEIEMFCHGALCMAYSGKCYLSLHENNHSANRGSCMQICRRGYRVTDLETGREMDLENKYIMSPKDLCTVEFMDKMYDSGVRVFKIEGRARSAEYVKKVVSVYRKAADAVEGGSFTKEFATSLKDELLQVFNRGFWDGYYMGARLGEWSTVYGSSATKKKVYAAKITNFFSNIGVAEVLVEAAPLEVGQHILIIGPTSGVVEQDIEEIRFDYKPVQRVEQGWTCSIPIKGKVRRADKIYIFEDTKR